MSRLVPPIATFALAALALLAAAPARADHGPAPKDGTLPAYLAVAERHWGAAPAPCVGAAGEPVPVHLALFDDPHPWVSARADQPGCRIWLDRDHWPGRRSPRRCVEIVHEWGHLLGHGHAERGLMSEEARGRVPGCDAFRAPRTRFAGVAAFRRSHRLALLLRRYLGRSIGSRAECRWSGCGRARARWHRAAGRSRSRSGPG